MRYLGIDYGEKRVGLAISDAQGVFAFPRETVTQGAAAYQEIESLIVSEGIGGIVIGIPTTYSGEQNPIEPLIRAFAVRLKEKTGIEPQFHDEQFSSVEASRFAPREAKDDAASAALILQRFLDAHPAKQ